MATDPLDELRASCRPARLRCTVALLLGQLEEADADLIRRALAAAQDPNDKITYTGIASHIKKQHAHDIKAATLSRHQNGECSCSKVQA